MDNPSGLESFLEDFSHINEKKILVHGGGNQVTSLAGKLGLLTQLVDGRRITNPENLEVAVMVYAGWLNTSVVSKLNVYKTHALGLSGADLNMIKADKRQHPTIDFGEGCRCRPK